VRGPANRHVKDDSPLNFQEENHGQGEGTEEHRESDNN